MVIMTEMPGITPAVTGFAERVVAEGFTDLSAELARMKEDPEAPAPAVRMRTSGRLQRSRDFH